MERVWCFGRIWFGGAWDEIEWHGAYMERLDPSYFGLQIVQGFGMASGFEAVGMVGHGCIYRRQLAKRTLKRSILLVAGDSRSSGNL